jgi:hypothetical protein
LDKVITTALLIIAGVIGAGALTSAFLPAVNRSSGAILVASAGVAERVKTDVAIVFAAGNPAANDVRFWAKNVGAQEVKAIEKSDLFLTTPSEIKRITYNASCAVAAPECWSYTFEGGATAWTQATTIKVTIRLNTLPAGPYTIKFVVPNGVSVEKVFSV